MNPRMARISNSSTIYTSKGVKIHRPKNSQINPQINVINEDLNVYNFQSFLKASSII